MAKTHIWYCESVKNHLHAFCLLRSPYKTSVKKKIVELSEGHGFLDWTLIKLTPEKAVEFFQAKFNCDELYVGEKPEKHPTFLCKRCFDSLGGGESLTIGRMLPSNCEQCGNEIKINEPYYYKWLSKTIH